MANAFDLDDPAHAFDELRREVSLCVRAIQGLTAERQNMPDYSATLRSIDARLQAAAEGIARIAQMPALRMTPTDLGQSIASAAAAARQGDRELLDTAHRGNTDLAQQLRQLIQQVQTAHAQRQRVLSSAAAGFAAGTFIVLSGWWMFG